MLDCFLAGTSIFQEGFLCQRALEVLLGRFCYLRTSQANRLNYSRFNSFSKCQVYKLYSVTPWDIVNSGDIDSHSLRPNNRFSKCPWNSASTFLDTSCTFWNAPTQTNLCNLSSSFSDVDQVDYRGTKVRAPFYSLLYGQWQRLSGSVG